MYAILRTSPSILCEIKDVIRDSYTHSPELQLWQCSSFASSMDNLCIYPAQACQDGRNGPFWHNAHLSRPVQ